MDKNIRKKIKELEKNIPTKFQDKILEAVEYSSKYHQDKERYGGEPMIEHLLNVAILTTEVGLDTNSTVASLLHEIPLDEKTKAEIKTKFKEDVPSILARLKQIKKSTQTTETPYEVMIKYILSSSKDLRPTIIKVLDTLCDMRTAENIPREKKKPSLRKALNIYSPLAEYLDLNEIKKEIEENAFKEYMPIEYESITKKMAEDNINEKTLEKYKRYIRKILKDLKFEKRIEGRVKCKYSIYNKLKKYEKEWISPNITRIDDLIAFRVLTNTEEQCYLVLEKIMDEGEPDYDLFDDYISNPKPNGYKAIQFPVTFKSVSDLEIEVQIMTHEMFYHNTYGPASHIAYKASKSRYAKPTNKYDWIEKIHKEMKKSKKLRGKQANVPIECKIFREEVFAFTPKGMILALDKGDTALDFAFKLHTEIGHSATGVLINGKAGKLSSPLKTGDVVEIKRDKNKKCQKIGALKMVNSDTSKFRIRNQLSKYERKG
jgi:GTP diphosphokinase / guanosine-3',5'-bis(diphosphate) 3'-diphosphatase